MWLHKALRWDLRPLQTSGTLILDCRPPFDQPFDPFRSLCLLLLQQQVLGPEGSLTDIELTRGLEFLTQVRLSGHSYRECVVTLLHVRGVSGHTSTKLV